MRERSPRMELRTSRQLLHCRALSQRDTVLTVETETEVGARPQTTTRLPDTAHPLQGAVDLHADTRDPETSETPRVPAAAASTAAGTATTAIGTLTLRTMIADEIIIIRDRGSPTRTSITLPRENRSTATMVETEAEAGTAVERAIAAVTGQAATATIVSMIDMLISDLVIGAGRRHRIARAEMTGMAGLIASSRRRSLIDDRVTTAI